ncbi:dual specificity tyrosine-phosphorylation-regulated kinase mbk-2-like [Anopheles funestus]|uniref:dual specificity tyrosine-phosphorylation-regulated kinase mbk-2-like n=1 Tax=Anopheles funestus TaxID=62324 RepID=UPI0020C6356D|nr:dual specificity tyrosine-phosphorylation-regulated kinase mbk-2-like [Anopheles funestus]XP_049281418.1 dual specificity tyrosine-phosphorylation-regulated kinase mbk-2-like [Anopheles funestus]XP_049281419.1 dual specificity tyrosine-phosphorylation-regulated kinase mbk-2-like [Anopheles funestus]
MLVASSRLFAHCDVVDMDCNAGNSNGGNGSNSNGANGGVSNIFTRQHSISGGNGYALLLANGAASVGTSIVPPNTITTTSLRCDKVNGNATSILASNSIGGGSSNNISSIGTGGLATFQPTLIAPPSAALKTSSLTSSAILFGGSSGNLSSIAGKSGGTHKWIGSLCDGATSIGYSSGSSGSSSKLNQQLHFPHPQQQQQQQQQQQLHLLQHQNKHHHPHLSQQQQVHSQHHHHHSLPVTTSGNSGSNMLDSLTFRLCDVDGAVSSTMSNPNGAAGGNGGSNGSTTNGSTGGGSILMVVPSQAGSGKQSHSSAINTGGGERHSYAAHDHQHQQKMVAAVSGQHHHQQQQQHSSNTSSSSSNNSAAIAAGSDVPINYSKMTRISKMGLSADAAHQHQHHHHHHHHDSSASVSILPTSSSSAVVQQQQALHKQQLHHLRSAVGGSSGNVAKGNDASAAASYCKVTRIGNITLLDPEDQTMLQSHMLGNSSNSSTTGGSSGGSSSNNTMKKDEVSLTKVAKLGHSVDQKVCDLQQHFLQHHQHQLQQMQQQQQQQQQQQGTQKQHSQHQQQQQQQKEQGNGGEEVRITESLAPFEVLRLYMDKLTQYEHHEIYNYPRIYFIGANAKKRRGAGNSDYDNEQGSYIHIAHDHIAYRYEVLKIIGKGSFGQVVKAYDHRNFQHVALKMIRNEQRFHRQAQEEIRILKHLRAQDRYNSMNIIHMYDSFVFRNHMCITFELLYINLYELIKKNKFKGFSMQLVRKFTHSLLKCLDALYKNKIIHCDMKPENILLKQQGRSGIKVIDFGSSCFENERVYTYIQSRFYRAPEVILGAKYDMAIDMWSLGCIVAELYTGSALLPGEDEYDQMACIIELLGMPPLKLLHNARWPSRYFAYDGDDQFPHYCSLSFREDGREEIQGSYSKRGRYRGAPGTRDLAKVLNYCDDLFLDFVKHCLRWDPKRRMTPQEALNHNWFHRMLPQSPQVVKVVSDGGSESAASTTVSTGTTAGGSSSHSTATSISKQLSSSMVSGGGGAVGMDTNPGGSLAAAGAVGIGGISMGS